MNSPKISIACSLILIFLLKHVKTNALPHNQNISTKVMTAASALPNIYQFPSVSKLFNKTICTFHMDLYDAESISCPNGYKFSILNAYIFDSGNTSCSSPIQPDSHLPLEFIRNKIQNHCRGETFCYIFKYYLTSEPYKKMDNLAANIFWNCYKLRREGIRNIKFNPNLTY